MNKLLVDLNIWVDIAFYSLDFSESMEFFTVAQQRGTTLYFPLCGYTSIFYVMRKKVGGTAAVEFLAGLQLRGVRMLPFGLQEIAVAQSFITMTDHEDACISATALVNKCNCIVTRNKKDFKNSPVKALTPKEVLSSDIGV